MADTKITALTALTAADPANDVIPIVDVSDTTMAASGTTKKISVNNILGASGTATLASATITGALTVDTTTLVVDSTNDRVGVGTASPANKLSVTVTPLTAGSDGLIINGPSSRQMIAGITGGTYSYAGVGANQVLLYAGNGQFNIVGDAQNVRIATSASSFVTLDTSANFNVGAGNVVMATSGKGIDFSATANSSGTMTSELLNDYEEGTWTGTLTGGTTNPTIPVTETGRYTKVGRVVTVQITFTNVNTLGASGLIGITGLPFTNNASVNSVGSVNFYSIATFTGSPFVALGASQSSLVCYSNISNSAFANVTHNASATGNYFTASITYTV